jgi:thiamine biosynthesis lipoprotein
VVALTPEAFHLFEVADNWYQVSNGLFDITSGVLRHVWNFDSDVLPADDVVKPYLNKVGWNKVQFNANEIGLPETGMELDLGGIAKEYAVDRAAQVLLDQGAVSGLVNLGGDLRILGPHLNGSPWLIQIAHPRISGAILANISIAKGSLTTSGDYIHYIDVKDKRYCHVMNPKTGQPVSWWQSVSVMAPYCLQAGKVSTIAMLLESRALGFLEEAKSQFLLVDPDGLVIQNLT